MSIQSIGCRRRVDVDARADEVVQRLFAGDSYEAIATDLGTSRGKIYSIAVANGARRSEQKIHERTADRKARQREFLESVINATAKADVLDFLDGLPDNSVACHIASPPYNVGKGYSTSNDAYAFSFWLGWQLQVLSELARTLQDGGTLFYQVGSTRGPDGTLYPIDVLLFQHLQTIGLTFQSRVAWVVPHGLTPKRRLSERYETCLVFSKGVQRTFNPDAARTPAKQPGKRAFKGPRKGELSGNPHGVHPSNVWQVSNAGHNRPGRVEGHPAQMPLELAKRAVLLYSLPGDLVVDCFAGSGTTAEACILTGRAFSGCDLGYEDVRAQRLSRVAPELASRLPGVTDESLAVWNAEATPVHIPANFAGQDELFASAG